MKSINAVSAPARRRSNQQGQAAILVVLSLGIFLLGASALSVDFASLWLHKQAAQSAADAACTAGVQDMLAAQNNPAFTPNFTVGSDLFCETSSGAAPCAYATENGYSSTLTYAAVSGTGSTAGNNVHGTFPSSVPGVTGMPGVTFPFFRID